MKPKKAILFVLIFVFMRFTGLQAQTVQDADGNIYVTLNIGKQVWIGENLKTTRLNDGTLIPLVTNDEKWKALKTPAYCWYNNDEKNKDTYGALYNWYTVKTGKICPQGWHVPTDTEWVALATFLGDENSAGDKLKEAGITHWKNYLSKATNDFDFTARPGGMRYYSGPFPEFGDSYAVWWSATGYSSTQAGTRGLHDSSSRFFKGYDDVRSGYSIRCIKN
jgi:uncharacterized protein (TIGR02145 family)